MKNPGCHWQNLLYLKVNINTIISSPIKFTKDCYSYLFSPSGKSMYMGVPNALCFSPSLKDSFSLVAWLCTDLMFKSLVSRVLKQNKKLMH